MDFAFVAPPEEIICSACQSSEHVLVLRGTKDYGPVMLDVIEITCQKHKLCIETFVVGQQLDQSLLEYARGKSGFISQEAQR